MGPYSAASRTEQELAEERRLNAARDAFPAWRIIEVFGGYLAVPAGTVIVQAIDLDGLAGKLREQP